MQHCVAGQKVSFYLVTVASITAMDIEVDIIEFRVPTENNKTLFVWDIQAAFSEAFIYESVWNIFCQFGALYLVKVCPNAGVAKPGFYALVKYFSAAQASKAQRVTHGRGLFQSSPLKVQLSTKQYPHFFPKAKPLSHSKCQDLANHYLGFNGWSTRIITLKDISNCDDANRLSPVPGHLEEVTLKYGCIIEVTFPHHAQSCRGVGVAEETMRGNAPDVVVPKRGKLQKWARDKAVVNAFEKVLLMVLGNGKVLVECRMERDDVLQDHDPEGVIKVNDIHWSLVGPGNQEEDEDIPWDLSVNM
ncbi:hypothetical protein UPYG_G00097250 [Umbra pygmaea]|uniref:RRM domain-containing protein n=1 Tax=Umbra pygmaea TaxID=75934 RepID=A0ABD0XKI8_UMBPY